jgi:hypothetical protein
LLLIHAVLIFLLLLLLPLLSVLLLLLLLLRKWLPLARAARAAARSCNSCKVHPTREINIDRAIRHHKPFVNQLLHVFILIVRSVAAAGRGHHCATSAVRG